MSNNLFSQDEEEIYTPQPKNNFLPLIKIFKRKAWLIASITALVTVGYVYWENKTNPPSEYAGTFQLLVEPLTFEAKSSEPTSLTDPKGVYNERLLAADYPTLLRLLKSNQVLSDIANEVKTKYPSFSVNNLSENLVVERVGKDRLDQSKIVAIAYTESNPELVELVLQETAKKYLDYSLESRLVEIGSGLEFIEQQLPQLNQKVSRSMNEVQDLQQQYQMVQADEKGESLLDTSRDLERQKMETRREIEEQTRIKRDLQSKLGITVEDAIAISALRDNPSYQNLVQEFKEKERELAVASATFNSSSPQVIALQEEKRQLSNLLNAEIRQSTLSQGISSSTNRLLLANNEDSILLSLVEQLVETANRLEALQARQQSLSRDASLFEAQVQEFPQVSRRYKELQQEIDIANRTREQMLIQKDKLQIQASQTQTPWRIVSQPKILRDSEGNPVPLPSDSQNKTILKGLLAGLILGMGVAVLIEKNRNSFYSVDDLEDSIDSFPILADIPFNPNLASVENKNLPSKPQINSKVSYLPDIEPIDSLNYDFLNAFDKLYANISLRYRHKSIRSIAICSPTRGDGRSTVALHLAKQIAARGKKVLLVDANSFNYQLPDKLVSANKAEENLFILIASQKALENSLERESLMSEFEANYDYVIYDTPPLLDSVTAGFLSVNTDGILLVSAIDKTSKSLLTKSLEQIENFKLPLLGLVANHISSKKLKGKETEEWNDINQTRLFNPISDSNTLDTKADSYNDTNGSNVSNPAVNKNKKA